MAVGEAPRIAPYDTFMPLLPPHGSFLSEFWRILLPPLSPQGAVLQDSTLILLKVIFFSCLFSPWKS